MGFSAEDHRYMARALELAARGLFTTQPNPRVGCVIVRDGQILAEAWHQQAGQAHAEAAALAKLGGRAVGATAYVTLEPCSHTGRTGPCADALISAGIARVVAAMQDPNPLVAGQGFAKLQAAGIVTAFGLMAQQAQALNIGFVSRMQRQRPWVRVKLAASLDGRTALANGESAWITGEAARADVQQWRARASMILTGAPTVLQDNPRMNLRIEQAHAEVPVAILDSGNRLKGDEQLFQLNRCYRLVAQAPQLDVDVQLAAKQGRLDLQAVMAWLNQQQCNELHVEAGAALAGALLGEDLVDEILLYQAPVILGSSARGLFDIAELQSMQQRSQWQLCDQCAIGNDIRLQYRCKL